MDARLLGLGLAALLAAAPATAIDLPKRKSGLWAEGKLNVAFADGHADTVPLADFNRVRVSPYQPRCRLATFSSVNSITPPRSV